MAIMRISHSPKGFSMNIEKTQWKDIEIFSIDECWSGDGGGVVVFEYRIKIPQIQVFLQQRMYETEAWELFSSRMKMYGIICLGSERGTIISIQN